MGRLIDADELIKEYPQASGLKLVIENAPTAYDVDKVVAEITSSAFWNAGVLDLDVTERIVRKGGVNG